MFSEGLVTIDEKDNLLVVINKIIKQPKLQAHFAPGSIVKNEAEIISFTGEKFRLDRVVFPASLNILESGSSAVIIDYKTGEEKTEHKKQILRYADLLNEMGYIVTEKLLVYIESEKVVAC